MQLVAVDFLPPQVLQRELLRVSGLLASGSITPLCTANYSLTSVVAAMRLLAQASHVGKVSGTVLKCSHWLPYVFPHLWCELLVYDVALQALHCNMHGG
jgi:hypothetical protein